MEAVPSFERVVKRNGLLQLEHPPRLRERQLPEGSSFFPAPTTTTTPVNEPTTTVEATTTTTEAPAPTTTDAATTTTTTTTSAEPSPTTTAAETTRTTTTSEETTTTRSRSSSSSAAADITVTNVITPTTVIVVGTSTITSALDPVTSAETRSLAPSAGANSGSSSGGLSTGAKIGIGVGAGVGGALVLAFLAFACLGLGRRKKNKDDAIVWPAIADSAALYPEPVHNTRAGFGVGDDDDEADQHSGGTGPSMAEAGAGAAGVGAAAGMLGGGYGSMSRHGHSEQPTLPQFPASVYANDQPYNGYYGAGSDGLAPEGSSAYTGYSTGTPSQQSHAPLALGPAAVGYGRSQDRHTPSPPRTAAGSGSADGHTQEGGSQLPFPGEPDEELAGPGRPVSPTPMQVGDTFGSGYDESDGGRRWRLSVVNDDPRDRD
ncbi:hypothetical protein JCM11251_002960 [Rhodosporidiobolus azoricus]